MRELTTNEVDQVSGADLPGGQSPLSIFADAFPLGNAALNLVNTGIGLNAATGPITAFFGAATHLPPGVFTTNQWVDQQGNTHTFNPQGPLITDQLGNQHEHSTYDPNAVNVFGRF